MIKRLLHGCFRIDTYIKPSVDISPPLRLGQMSTLGLDIGADMKTARFSFNLEVTVIIC